MTLLNRTGIIAAGLSALVLIGCGKDGANGTAGLAGAQSLVRTSAAAPSVCSAGGVVIESGVDANGNGVLDASEVNAALTTHVCNGAAGATGAPGQTGAAGQNGTDGTNGTNGLNALVRTVVATTCANGGFDIQAGSDTNGNGALDDGEVNAALTKTICNGAPGANGQNGQNGVDGQNSLVKMTVDAAACGGVGGVLIQTGLDANANGTLDAGEVAAAQNVTVCNGTNGTNGANGKNALVRTSAVAPGATCAAGGILVEAGVDTSGDNLLQDGEVTATQTVCNGADGANGAGGANGFDTVLRITQLFPGDDPACAAGGVLVEAGLDANRSGTLDPGEESAALTSRVCNGETPTTSPHGTVSIVYAPIMDLDTTTGDQSFLVEVTDGADFLIGDVLVGAVIPEQLRVTIRNRSGGVLGTGSWGAPFLMATWEQPADGFQRTITFEFDPGSFSWIEVSRTPVDVPAPPPII